MTHPTPNPTEACFGPTDLNRVRRIAERGRYRHHEVFEVIDQSLIAHVGFVDGGRPIVIPMTCARDGDTLLIHGARKGRLAETTAGQAVCLTITLLDALVYARSIFHSSMNYRSAVVHGVAHAITDPTEQLQALHVMTEHLMPGRWAEVRAPLAKELRATQVLRVTIEVASAKVRDVGVLDDPADYSADEWATTWAGLLPLAQGVGQPVAAPTVSADVVVPASVWRAKGRQDPG